MADTLEMHKVQVWFGEHVIASYVHDADHATRYAEAMDRRFPGLKITDDVLPLRTPNGGQPGGS